MRRPDAPPIDLDPETSAIVDEVCSALEWYDPAVPGSTEYAHAQQFGERWLIAWRNTGDANCRQRIMAACDAIVGADPALFVSRDHTGAARHIFSRQQIGEYEGRVVYLADAETGELREVLQWPVARYAGGDPCYDDNRRAGGRAA